MNPTVVCMGEALIDFVPADGGLGLAQAARFVKAAGGAPANVAVGLARLGVTTGFLGMVGSDPFGDFLVDTLAAEGIDVSSVRRTSESPTGVAFVSLTAEGEREFMFYRHPGADTLLRPQDVAEDTVRACQMIHFGSIGLITSPSREGTLHAVDLARDAGRRVSYDANLRLDLWPSSAEAKEGLLSGLNRANIIKLSDDELAFLTGQTDPSRGVRDLWHDGLELMVVTMGKKGSFFATGDFQGSDESFVVETVDTTGAGDGFMAGLLAGVLGDPESLQDSDRLKKVCRFANAVGALATTVRGGIPGMPTRGQVDKFLVDRG